MPDTHGPMSRVTRPHADAQRGYDRLSRWYDALTGRWEDALRQQALDRLSPTSGETVLEIGCGTGRALPVLAAAIGPNGAVHGLDLSSGMLTVAGQRLRRAGATGNIQLVGGDATALPYASAGFDAVFLSFTLELFDTPEIPIALAECRRVLKRGGRIGVVALSRAGGLNLAARLYEWGHRTFPHILDCRLIYVRQSLEQAGFRISEARRMSLWGLPVDIVLATRPILS